MRSIYLGSCNSKSEIYAFVVVVVSIVSTLLPNTVGRSMTQKTGAMPSLNVDNGGGHIGWQTWVYPGSSEFPI